MKLKNNELIWDDIIIETFNLDKNNFTLDELTEILKKNKLIKGNYVKLDKSTKDKIIKDTYKYTSRIRLNIFLAYILSNYTTTIETPNCYYCSYNKDFTRIPENDIHKILTKYEVN